MSTTKQVKQRELDMHDAVMALTDHEVNTLLVQLLELDHTTTDTTIKLNDDITHPTFDPINDDQQALRLMVQFDVERNYEPYDFFGWHYTMISSNNPLRIMERQDIMIEDQDKPDLSLNQCVCRLIVLNRCPQFAVIANKQKH